MPAISLNAVSSRVEVVVGQSAAGEIVDLQVRLADRAAEVEAVVGGDGGQHRQGQKRSSEQGCFTHAEDLRV